MPGNLNMPFAGMRTPATFFAHLRPVCLAHLQICGPRKSMMDWLFPRDGIPPDDDEDDDEEEDD